MTYKDMKNKLEKGNKEDVQLAYDEYFEPIDGKGYYDLYNKRAIKEIDKNERIHIYVCNNDKGFITYGKDGIHLIIKQNINAYLELFKDLKLKVTERKKCNRCIHYPYSSIECIKDCNFEQQ